MTDAGHLRAPLCTAGTQAHSTYVAPGLECEPQGSGARSLPVARAATTVPSEQGPYDSSGAYVALRRRVKGGHDS